jgi:exonuclease III
VLSAKKKEFNLIGVYVHNEANIFNHKKSFMQDLHDLLEREVKYDKLRTGGTYNSSRQSVANPSFGGAEDPAFKRQDSMPQNPLNDSMRTGSIPEVAQ